MTRPITNRRNTVTYRIGITLFAVLLGAGISLGAEGAKAHHSFAMFDPEKIVTIEGTITSYDWRQPHVWVDVMVPQPSGEAIRWGGESQSPGILSRRGWRHDSIKAGDNVIMVVHPMRDGTPGGQVLKISVSDGRVFTTEQGDSALER